VAKLTPIESTHPPFAVSPVEIALALILVPLVAAVWIALISAEIGRFSPVAAAIGGAIAFGVVGAGGAWGFRRRSLRLDWAAWWDPFTLVYIAFVLIAVWPSNTPWPAFLDATWYVNTAARIARDGSLTFHPEALAIEDVEAQQVLAATFVDERALGLPFPADPGRGFHAVVFAVPEVGSVEPAVHPYHPPFFAAGLALATHWLGPLRTGEGVLPWALVYLLAVAAMTRAAFGPAAALLSIFMVSDGPAFAYYGANPYAELAAGALAVTGVWCLVRLVSWSGVPEPRTGPHPFLAFGAGLAFGLAGLAKVDLWPVAVVGALWWWHARRRAGGWREGTAFGLGIAVPAAHFAILALTVSNFYVRLNGGGVVGRLQSWLPYLAALAVVLAIAGIIWSRRRSAASDWESTLTGPGARRLVAVAVVVGLGMAMVATWLAPADAPPSMVAILAWLVTPLGLWAAVAGLALVLEGDDPRAGPIVALALSIVPLLLVDPVVTRSLSSLYTARRLVPVVLPLVAALAAIATVHAAAALRARHLRERMIEQDTGNPSSEPVAGGTPVESLGLTPTTAVGALLLAGAFGLFWFGLAAASEHVSSEKSRDFAGGAAMAQRLAAYGDPRDVLLFASTLDGTHSGQLAAAVWTLEDRPTAVLGPPEPDGAAVAAAVDAWGAQGRRVYYIDDGRKPAPEFPGYVASEVGTESLVTQVLAPSPELPPRFAPLALDFRVMVLEPSGTEPTGSPD
jgi:hypothetical protein